MEIKRLCIRVCAYRHVSAPDPPGEGCRFLPMVRGPVTIQGVRTPTGGSDSPVVRAERLLLPEHVVLPDLSQPGDGSGTVVGRTGLSVRRGPAAGRS